MYLWCATLIHESTTSELALTPKKARPHVGELLVEFQLTLRLYDDRHAEHLAVLWLLGQTVHLAMLHLACLPSLEKPVELLCLGSVPDGLPQKMPDLVKPAAKPLLEPLVQRGYTWPPQPTQVFPPSPPVSDGANPASHRLRLGPNRYGIRILIHMNSI